MYDNENQGFEWSLNSTITCKEEIGNVNPSCRSLQQRAKLGGVNWLALCNHNMHYLWEDPGPSGSVKYCDLHPIPSPSTNTGYIWWASGK
jgi:hypothetical protein